MYQIFLQERQLFYIFNVAKIKPIENDLDAILNSKSNRSHVKFLCICDMFI